jgi:hypothetical protein
LFASSADIDPFDFRLVENALNRATRNGSKV